MEEMPVLTEGRWFLRMHVAAGRMHVQQRLQQAATDMKALAKADQRITPPFGFIDLSNEFLCLVRRAEQDLSILQSPYQMHSRVQLPSAAQEPPDML